MVSKMQSSSVNYNNDIYLGFASLGVNTSGSAIDSLSLNVSSTRGQLTLEQLKSIIDYYNDSWIRMKANRSTPNPTKLRPPPPPAPLSPSAKRFLQERKKREEALAREGKIMPNGNGRPTLRGWNQGIQKMADAFRKGFDRLRSGDTSDIGKVKFVHYPVGHKLRRDSFEQFKKHNDNLYAARLAKKILEPPEKQRLLWTSTTQVGQVSFPYEDPRRKRSNDGGGEEWYFTETPSRERDVIFSSKKRGISYSLGETSEGYQANLIAKNLLDNMSIKKQSFSLKDYFTDTVPKAWNHYTEVNHDSKNQYHAIIQKKTDGTLDAGKYAMKPHHKHRIKETDVKCVWKSDGTRLILDRNDMQRSDKDYFVLHGGFQMKQGPLYPSITTEKNTHSIVRYFTRRSVLSREHMGRRIGSSLSFGFYGRRKTFDGHFFFYGEEEEDSETAGKLLSKGSNFETGFRKVRVSLRVFQRIGTL